MSDPPEIQVAFTINGIEHRVLRDDADRSLGVFIREVALLRGTKIVCEEGGCGACTVTIKTLENPTPVAINSCLVSVLACNGWQITTIEGIGSTAEGLGKVQAAVAAGNATQCGFCTPGVIMSVSSLIEKKGENNVSMAEVEKALSGNLCRCTGYRPIIEAFKPFCTDASQNLKAKLADIEDLCRKRKFCSKSGALCPGNCSETPTKSLTSYKTPLGADGFWIKVKSCKEVQDLISAEKGCAIVAGNTAHGVYDGIHGGKNKFIDISGVEELKVKTFNGKKVVLGAALSISEAQEYLQAICDKPGFSYLHQMIKHIDYIANLSIRNIGSIGGNIAIKYLKDDLFSSDLFVLFAGANAQMEILNLDGKVVNLQMTDESVHRNFQKIALIKSFVLQALDNDVVYKTYKVSARNFNCEAFVSASFLLERKNNTITRFETVQEGIYFRQRGRKDIQKKLASHLDFMIGKKWVDVINNVKNSVGEECLSMNLVKKFLVSLDNNAINLDLHMQVSKGYQEFDTDKSVWPLNQPVIKMEALEQCAGEAVFTDDMPAMKGELHAAPILASAMPGTILEIDTSEAALKGLDGVFGVFTHRDIPGSNTFTPLDVHMNAEDEEIFCSNEVKFNGQILGIVVATSRAKAMKAASKLVIKDVAYRPRETVLTIDQALKAGGDRVKIGPIKGREAGDKSSTEALKVITGSMEIGNQFHFSLESQTCLCVPEEGAMKVYSATQWADLVQKVVSRTLAVPTNTIQVQVKRLGGGFGSKISRASQVAAACAVAANALKRPVRMVLDLRENMRIVGGRASLKTKYEVAVDKNGKIIDLDSSIYQNCGFAFNDSPLLVKTLKFYFGIGYDSSRFRVTPYECKTDAPSTTWCRAPGATEAIVFLEEVFEKTAAELGLDPMAVRMENLGDKDSPLPKMVEDLKAKSDFTQRKEEIAKFNKENKYIKKGLAILPMKYPFILWGNYHAMVSVYHADGTVAVTHGGIEMGQGVNTKVAQACASAFGIPFEMVKVEPNTTLTAPNSMVTGASIASDTCSLCVTRACAEIMRRLQPVKEELGESAPWLQIVQEAYKKNVNLCYNYMFNPTEETITYDIYVVAAAEVELDVLTGQKKVARVDILEDVGRSLSPLIDVGQIEGAFVMGLGYWMSEGYTFDQTTGKLESTGTFNYKIPGAKDIPEDFRVYFRKDAPNMKGVLQTKATGEPAVAISVVCLYALRYAIAEVWKDHGVTNKHVNIDLPATPENVLKATYTMG